MVWFKLNGKSRQLIIIQRLSLIKIAWVFVRCNGFVGLKGRQGVGTCQVWGVLWIIESYV